jgi:hypothetical protein
MYLEYIANALYSDGEIIIGLGELFCRIDISDEDEVAEYCSKVG